MTRRPEARGEAPQRNDGVHNETGSFAGRFHPDAVSAGGGGEAGGNRRSIRPGGKRALERIYAELPALRFWLPTLPVPDLVQWNCGLWDMGDDYQEGRHFYPPDLYEETCHRICRVLRKLIRPDLAIVIATTTPTMHGDHGDILLYNDILRKVAAEENAAVNDLYAVVAPAKEEMIGEDHIHLTPAGVEACAAQTAGVIRSLLEKG